MDNVRLFLFLGLAFVSMLLWQAWQQDYGTAPASAPATAPVADGGTADTPDTPAVAAIDTANRAPEASGGASQQPAPDQRVEVFTDRLHLSIDTRGGTISQAFLQNYPATLNDPQRKFQLLGTSPKDFFIAQSGLLSADKERAPTHKTLYTSAQDSYTLAPGQDKMSVDLVWQGPAGLKVIKRYTLFRGSHRVELQHIVENGSAEPWKGREYRQLQRGEPAKSGNRFMYTYTGAAIYTPENKYHKYSFDKLSEGEPDLDVTGGWVAMIQHYFLAAIVPPRDLPEHFYGKGLPDGHYVIGTYTPAVAVAAGSSHTFDGSVVIGPKLQDELAAIAPGLDLTVDYGWLTFIAKPIYLILKWIDKMVGNWGWTIIIFTILIKLVFYKLSETSYRSMANMRKLGPRIQALKDRYGDDKQRMQQAMMDIYKKEKINPLGGCLPMVIQIPFFLALYWVLLENVELRQAPWIFWLNDLSTKDPYFVLPVLMGITMLVQQKLNPAPPDPMQAKIMMALPLVFTAMFAFFPSGLVLYWFTNNLLSIAQQWLITKRMEAGAKA